MNSFLNGNFPNIRFFRIEECSVSDHDFQKVLLRLELLHGPKDVSTEKRTKICVFFYLFSPNKNLFQRKEN